MASDRPAETTRARLLLNPATIILVCAIGLTSLGLSILFSASASFKTKQGVDVPYQYLQKQIVGVVAAAALCFIASRVNLDYLRRYAWWIGGVLLVGLVLVLIPHVGIDVKGSRRWLGYGALRLQVSEFAKFGLVFCVAHYLALNQTRIGEFKRGFLIPLGIIGAFAVLVMKEPDFGTAALMVAVGLVLLFLAGAKWRYTLPAIVLVGTAFAVVVSFNENRMRRLMEFMSEEKSYQLRQALAAFAAGGTDGTGLGQGRQQLTYLPEAHTDFIFSIVGEELGLWCTLGVVVVFTIMFIAGLIHLRRAPNLFHFLLVTGCLLMICMQAIINLGVVTGIFPTKGMSLPFISAGLSNLLLMGLLLGILLNTQRTWGRVALPTSARSMREVLA
ncbi:MAG: putative peptidoglycan glycosyltransferase FtsW [Verrucomicrobia bacterium]|nr:putative peptidoglycan glycosyltransferase FtsW [Verrucomicrobiota bacterium]